MSPVGLQMPITDIGMIDRVPIRELGKERTRILGEGMKIEAINGQTEQLKSWSVVVIINQRQEGKPELVLRPLIPD